MQNNTSSISENTSQKIVKARPVITIKLIIALILFALFLMFMRHNDLISPGGTFRNPSKTLLFDSALEMAQFANITDVQSYIGKAPSEYDAYYYPVFGGEALSLRQRAQSSSKSYSTLPERISQTNVQVVGIDEPDIIKTDGKTVYYSTQRYGINPAEIVWDRDDIGVPPVPLKMQSHVKVVNIYPPEGLKEIYSIDENGEMLLYKDTLVVLVDKGVVAYEVKDQKKGDMKWSHMYDDGISLVSARLSGDEVFLVTGKRLNSVKPCPFNTFADGEFASISCTDIYYPLRGSGGRVVFTGIMMDARSGKVLDMISFIGSSYDTTFYMSEHSLYFAYTIRDSIAKTYMEFLKTIPQIPSSITSRIDAIISYDISPESIEFEISNIIGEYFASLDDDDRLKLQNDIASAFSEYVANADVSLVNTGIVKIDREKIFAGLSISATGLVPGSLLNQFSIDEHASYLRVATMQDDWGQHFGGISLQTRVGSTNNVYILNGSLDVVASVEDMGIDERIYAVRFLGEMGYVVTFREIDPFYVLDLKNPYKPRLTGELKIPGFSSYLHPLTKHTILGVGSEGSNVKVSIFDVSDPAKPIEKDTYMLNEYWTSVQDTHHAFLQDEKHGVFFIPGSEGGYIFSYEGDKLTLERAVSKSGITRALFIDDYLYVIGDGGITVLDENTWKEVSSLIF